MRRVQRFYPAQGPVGESLPDWKIFAHIGEHLSGGEKPRISAGAVMREIVQQVPRYAEMDYARLARVEDQFPDVGGDDLYYGGTAYTNRGGLGVMWASDAEDPKEKLTVRPVKAEGAGKGDGLVAVPVRVLYDRATLFEPSTVMAHRVPAPYAELNSQDAARLGIAEGDRIAVLVGDLAVEVTARVDGKSPAGMVLLPQRLARSPLPTVPAACSVQKIEE
jgi:predicted molibdopterin-dependent oxidoreductase YjgC